MGNEFILGPDGELYHHGIKGMRWGIRRFQTKDGSLTPAGKKRYDKEMAKVKAETKKLKAQERTDKKIGKLEEAKKNLQALKNRKKVAAEQEKTEKAAETDEQTRERIFTKPTAEDVIENRHLFSDREVQALRLRLQDEQYIKNMIPAEVDKGKEFVGKAVDKFNQVTTLVDNGSKAWNSVAKIYNSFYGNKHDAALPMISDKITSKLDKLKEQTETAEYENRLDKAKKEMKDRYTEKEKSALEKLKEETEAAEHRNRLEKAQADIDKRNNPKAEDPIVTQTKRDNLEQARLNAENKRREAEHKKADLDAEDAKRAAKSKASADEAARKDNESRSQAEYDKESSTYRKQSGESTNTGRGTRLGLPSPKAENSNSSGYGSKTYQKKVDKILSDMDDKAWDMYYKESSSRGKSYVDNASSTTAISTNVASKIRAMTSNSNKTYSEIANQLGVSVSTVQNYSRGRDTAYELIDRYGNSILDFD